MLDDFTQLVSAYEYHLQKSTFLTGNQMTYVDVVIFIEIDTVRVLFRNDLPGDCPMLNQWYKNMKREKELARINENFYELVRTRNLAVVE